ncbi:MAG: 3-dehydroquinate synthase [Elusimicrobia bacterium]|nr:3-dehydroquinate synthase [Elusimicrobiota bacterium]
MARLYGKELAGLLAADTALLIDATEANKSLEAFPGYVEKLIAKGVRRGDVLVAIGGGIIQDITCFLAATLLRGLEWHFIPTTLLAQADSCIGSKSSINAGDAKNILGTFTPAKTVLVAARFLDTLDEKDVRSGLGEMLKVHAIEGPDSFDRIAKDYPRLLTDRPLLLGYVRRSLEIKKRLIELDEFDRGPRQVLNYGHSFGHAIEAATDFAVPHGIAVTMGADMANYVAARLGRAPDSHFRRMHPVLRQNYRGFESQRVPPEDFFRAMGKDKKNTADRMGVILPGDDGRPAKVLVAPDEGFRAACKDYLEEVRSK